MGKSAYEVMEKYPNFRVFQSKMRKMRIGKIGKSQGETCFLGISE